MTNKQTIGAHNVRENWEWQGERQGKNERKMTRLHKRVYVYHKWL